MVTLFIRTLRPAPGQWSMCNSFRTRGDAEYEIAYAEMDRIRYGCPDDAEYLILPAGVLPVGACNLTWECEAENG